MPDTNTPPLRLLSQDQIDQTIAAGEFPPSVRQAAERVVVVMTQDWCPQWHDMARWLPEFCDRAAIFCLVYNTRPDFGRIMAFKETVFGNYEVPYLRYYRQGELLLACNWLPKATFAAMLERSAPIRLG
jgi:hypothetical protein